MNKQRVVIFVFLKGNKILIEKRTLEQFKGEQYLIPGGTVKEDLESLEEALKREIREELGVIPLEFLPLLSDKKIKGLKGQLLAPFLINKWEGNLPQTILDKGNCLIWLEIEEVLTTPIKPTREIVAVLKKYLKTK